MTGQLPPESPFGAVVIGPREIYDAVVRTSQQVAQVAQQLTTMVERLNAHEQRTDARFKELEQDTGARFQTADTRMTGYEDRVRALEARMFPLPAVAVVVTVAAGVVSTLVALLTH